MSIAEKLAAIAENEQKVFDAGAKSEHDRFWDDLQENGNRKNYDFAFAGEAWDAETFNPKHPIEPTSCFNMFAYWGRYNSTQKPLVDMRKYSIDFSQATTGYSLFFNNRLVCAVGEINASNFGLLQSLFDGATKLHTIEKIIFPATERSFTNTFNNCTELQHITVEGVIGKSINFQWSPLTAASIRSVVNALSSTATGQTATINKAAKEAAFTDEEWAALIAGKTNWTFSLV